MVGAFLALVFAVCPSSTPQPNQPGTVHVTRLPLEKAMKVNAEGKLLYRQENFAAAVEKYQEALSYDPEMFAAQFNFACGLSRLRRYAEATDQAVQLIRHACIPWFREIFESADLAILRSTPWWKKIQQAQKESCRNRGQGVREGVLFVARTRPPVRVKGEGILVIRPYQEVFAYLPESGRYLQSTAEDGRVLALASSRNNYQFAYILGGKVIRKSGAKSLLRNLSLRMVDTTTMEPSVEVPLPGDWETLSFVISPGAIVELELVDSKQKLIKMQFDGERLETVERLATPPSFQRTLLTAEGVSGSRLNLDKKRCPFSLVDTISKTGEPCVQVHIKKQNSFSLSTSYGSGIFGLPFPTGPTETMSGPKPR